MKFKETKIMTVDRNIRKISVAFICLGNYCRSPMAEAVFRKNVVDQGLDGNFLKIDSFGTCSFHIGERPDPRTISICKKYNVPINHYGQMISCEIFEDFDYIIGMDNNNIRDLRRACKNKNHWNKIKLFGEWNLGNKVGRIVEDPWCGDMDDFEYNYIQFEHLSKGFLEKELV